MSEKLLNETWKNNINSMSLEDLSLHLEINRNIVKEVQLLSTEFHETSHERERLCTILRITRGKEEYITNVLKGKSET